MDALRAVAFDVLFVTLLVVTVWWLARGRRFLRHWRARRRMLAEARRLVTEPNADLPEADWLSERRLWRQVDEALGRRPTGPPVIPGRDQND